MIRLEGLVRRYDGRVVVDHVDLEVAAGEVFTLLGPSGCGKTTTLRLVAGLDRPDEGTIRLGGDEVAGGRWVPPEGRGLGMVFQSFALWPHRTVRENVAYPLRVRGAPDAAARADAALARVHLAGFGDRYPHTLSGGQQQRVALARALVARPRAILLDEPLAALDASLRADLRAQIAELVRADGLTVVLVTHDREEAIELSDRIGVMRAGRLVQVGAPRALYEAPADAFVARLLGEVRHLPAIRRDGVVRVDGVAVGTVPGPDGAVVWAFRPEWADFAEEGVPATVTRSTWRGATTRHRLEVAGAALDLDTARPPAPAIRIGRGWAWERIDDP